MSVVARTLASVPKRSASATWNAIVDLIAPDNSAPSRRELEKVAGVVCTCIADEALEADPLVVHGAGPRLRIYALYGDDAIEGDGANESPLSFVPTGGDWRMSVPCPKEDLEWVQQSLARATTRVTARALGDVVAEDDSDDDRTEQRGDSAATFVVDHDAFFRR